MPDIQVSIMKGATSANFLIKLPGASQYSAKLAQQYELDYDQNGLISLIRVSDRTKLIDKLKYSQIINGETGQPFADYPAILAYCQTIFFL